MGQQVFTAIITGKPVPSANTHVIISRRVGKFTRAALKHSPEYKAWFDSALAQLDKHLVNAGHTPIRALVANASGKNSRKQETFVTNPLFTHDDGMRYRVQVWFAAPTHLYKKDGDEYVYRQDGEHHLQAYKADADGPLKGIKDALEEAGVIDNDFYVDISGPVYRVMLPTGSEPFLVVEVSDASEPLPPHEGAFPPPPIWPTGDLSLYMPRVFEGSHDWHVDRKREEAYQEYLVRHGKVAPVVISKIRCKRCHLLIGSGHVATEIWAHWGDDAWGESRWTNKVVMICDLCAEERFTREDTRAKQETSDLALELLRKSGASVDAAPLPGDRLFAEYTMAYAYAEKQVRRTYRERYLLVAATEIATVDWTSNNPDKPGIEERRRAKQVEIFNDAAAEPHNHQPSPGPRLPRTVRQHRYRQSSRQVPEALQRDGGGGPVQSGTIYKFARRLRSNLDRRD